MRGLIENLLYPEVRPYGRADRDRLLKKASETPLDMVERLGILVGLVLVVVITRYSAAGPGLPDRVASAVANLIVALPLLVLAAGAVPRSASTASGDRADSRAAGRSGIALAL
jgi:hypothetical protein